MESDGGKVLGQIVQTVAIADYAAEVAQRRQEMVEPEAAAEPLVLGVGVTELGVDLAVGGEANVQAQSTGLLDEVHVRHDLRGHLAEPLGIDGSHRHAHKEYKDLYTPKEIEKRGTKEKSGFGMVT